MAQAASPELDVTPLTDKVTEVGEKAVTVALALGVAAVVVWGAFRLYSIFAGKGR